MLARQRRALCAERLCRIWDVEPKIVQSLVNYSKANNY